MHQFVYPLKRLTELAARDRRALAAAACYLLRASMIYRRQPAAALITRLQRSSGDRRPDERPMPVDADRMLWALDAAGRWLPWRTDCLVQALAADLWLDRLHVASTFHLAVDAGAPADGDPAAAHAWLEVDGQPVSGGRRDPAMTRFAEV